MYVLIIIGWLTGYVPTTTTQEFSSERACEAARGILMTEAANRGSDRMSAFCVAK